MTCKYENIESNMATCRRNCKKLRVECANHNHDLALKFGRVVEKDCEKSSSEYEEEREGLVCEICSEFGNNCGRILNAVQLLNGQNTMYSGFSGYCAVVPPNYLTIDLGEVRQVEVVQFLLWDNRGNNKAESSETKNFYRLLISDYSGDVYYDESNKLVPSDKQNSVKWNVVYDSLRIGHCGWQVFKFKVPVKLRYIRLHLLANSECISSKIVGLEVYGKPLVGYEYPYLPTFVTTIENEEQSGDTKNSSVNSMNINTIGRFSNRVSTFLEKKYKQNKEDGTEEIAENIKLLKDELDLVTKEAAIYENRLQKVKEKIYSNTNKQFRVLKISGIVSITLLVLSVIWEILQRTIL